MMAVRIVRFALEIIALVTVAVWGFTVDAVSGLGIVVGLGAPLLLAVLWGLFVAPRARWFGPLPARLVVEVVVFGAAVWALADLGHPGWAAVLAAVMVVDGAIVHLRRDVERMRAQVVAD